MKNDSVLCIGKNKFGISRGKTATGAYKMERGRWTLLNVFTGKNREAQARACILENATTQEAIKTDLMEWIK